VFAEVKAVNASRSLSEPAKGLAAAETANKHTKGTNATPAAAAATTGLVKMARIDNTNEFGVFPESCWKCTRANALTIGTRQVCEAERDRINAKRLADNDSVENLVTHGDVNDSQQQNPAAEALEKALDSMESVDVGDRERAGRDWVGRGISGDVLRTVLVGVDLIIHGLRTHEADAGRSSRAPNLSEES